MQNKPKQAALKIHNLKNIMIIGYTLIIVSAIFFVSRLSLHKTEKVLKNKVASMTSSLNVQMKLNLNSYLLRMETIGTLAFAAEESYTYDATSPDNDEYEAIATEKIISDKLYSLCIMENFVDYGIVYSNNHVVGKISNGTKDLFGDSIYSELSSMVSRPRTQDGWATGYKSNFKRIYYVKTIHENAVLVISFYATELEDVFDNPEALDAMEIRLTDRNYNMIYSSLPNEVGSPLPAYIKNIANFDGSFTIMNDDYLVTVDQCGDDWFVICSIPTKIILSERNEVAVYIYIVATAVAVLAVIFGILLSLRIAAPVTSVVSNLNDKAQIDLLTGILNKRTFEEYAENRISTALSFEAHALILIDLDNFKGVNDTLGHAYGDQVLAKIGSILRLSFSSEEFLGRIGGDEFAVFLNSSPDDIPYKDFVKSKCEELCEAFKNNYTGDDGSYKISGSIGVAFFPEHGSTFKDLYSASDSALYISKRNGKDTYTFAETASDKGGDSV